MDEKELEKLKADFASAQAALTAKEVELAAKVEENSVIVAENTALKASVQEKEQAIAEYTKKELLGARLATITEAGIPLETDPEKLLKKKEFYIGLSDEAFAEYVADLQNVVASVSKPDFIAVASRRAASFPRFDANADSTILLTDLSSRLKGLTRTPVTNE